MLEKLESIHNKITKQYSDNIRSKRKRSTLFYYSSIIFIFFYFIVSFLGFLLFEDNEYFVDFVGRGFIVSVLLFISLMLYKHILELINYYKGNNFYLMLRWSNSKDYIFLEKKDGILWYHIAGIILHIFIIFRLLAGFFTILVVIQSSGIANFI